MLGDASESGAAVMSAESRHADTSWLLSLCAARMGASMMFLSYPAGGPPHRAA